MITFKAVVKKLFFFQRKMWLQLLELVAHKTMVDPISSFAESGQPACVHVPAGTWTRPLPCLRMFHSMYKLNTSTLTWPSCEVCWALDLWSWVSNYPCLFVTRRIIRAFARLDIENSKKNHVIISLLKNYTIFFTIHHHVYYRKLYLIVG